MRELLRSQFLFILFLWIAEFLLASQEEQPSVPENPGTTQWTPLTPAFLTVTEFLKIERHTQQETA